MRLMVLEVLLLAALLAGSLAPLMALPPARGGCESSSWVDLPVTIDVNHTIRAAVLGLHPGLALGIRGAGFVMWGALVLLAARAANRFLRAGLINPTAPLRPSAAAAGLALGVLAAPLVLHTGDPPLASPAPEPASPISAETFRFLTHWAPRTDQWPVERAHSLLAVSAEQTQLWVSPEGVRHVQATERFPSTTQVLMDEGARVSDLIAVADVAMAHGAEEVVWVLPCEHWTPRRPSCTATRYGLAEAMNGPITRGPVTIRAVRHSSDARPGVPWTDELSAGRDTSLREVLRHERAVELQHGTVPRVRSPLLELAAQALLVGLALGCGLFLLRWLREAAAARRLLRTASARPRTASEPRSGAAVFPTWLPWQCTTHVVESGSPYRAAPGVLTARAGLVMLVGFGRLRGPLAMVVAAMLVLSSALLCAV